MNTAGWRVLAPAPFTVKRRAWTHMGPRKHTSRLVPVKRAWRGVVVGRDVQGQRVVERCPHAHATKDDARRCAARTAGRRVRWHDA
jgi:hypothetical protein